VNVLLALGIRHVGWETAGLLAQHAGSLAGLLDVTAESLQAIEGIGPIVANSIVAWTEREEHQALVRRLVDHGINPTADVGTVVGGTLEGLTIVVTGRLDTMSRNDAEDRIRSLGGKVGSAITKGTDYLVVGAEAGTKLAKAEKLGTKQLTEEEFAKLLEDGPEAVEETAEA
jgi:DNA ligase (NAD+)